MSWVFIGVSVVTAAVGAGVTIYGQEQQREAADDTADYNFKLAQNEATRNSQIAAENSRRAEIQKNKILRSIAAGNAANNLAMEGTPLAVMGTAAQELDLQILDLNFDSQNRTNAGFAEAQMGKWQAKQTRSALRTSQWATGISAASSSSRGYLSSTGQI